MSFVKQCAQDYLLEYDYETIIRTANSKDIIKLLHVRQECKDPVMRKKIDRKLLGLYKKVDDLVYLSRIWRFIDIDDLFREEVKSEILKKQVEKRAKEVVNNTSDPELLFFAFEVQDRSRYHCIEFIRKFAAEKLVELMEGRIKNLNSLEDLKSERRLWYVVRHRKNPWWLNQNLLLEKLKELKKVKRKK